MLFRLFMIAILLIILAGLCYYGGTHTPWLKLSTCIKNPEQYDGQLVTYIHEPKIEKLTSEGFILHYSKGTIPVLADNVGLRENEYIGLVATFHQEGYLEAVDLVISKNRRYKILFSIIPVFLVAILFFRKFKFTWKAFQIEIKHA